MEWPIEDIRTLQKNYVSTSIEELSKMLNRDPHAIIEKVAKLRLRKKHGKPPIQKHQKAITAVVSTEKMDEFKKIKGGSHGERVEFLLDFYLNHKQ